MTTMDSPLPTVTQIMGMRLARLMAKRETRSKEGTRALTLAQTLIRVILHIAGFGFLTYAGFTLTLAAGLIMAAVSCFALSWLMTRTTTNEPPPASRR